ncbi:DHA2 family efflux MFS transporter permease subunit [Geomonas edaphica]|uniref:DHA2 family efflux MFS transporter permease subunit n=1 Tax=Geomonas edaphica TaxID=2570226 RepID=UPI0018E085C3|nr:DHA2 family efflux MFS transporter permease subunit [Geomonas edaphica]
MHEQTSSHAPSGAETQLSGGMLWIAAIILAAANFIAVLNMTIANVAVPNIAGSLGATLSQGTWVITSYAVGEAITVPLTGWLSARYGAVRVFVWAMVMFGVFSAVSGLANSLGLLVVARIFQGFSGGPLMPLSQTLLMRIFPKEKTAAAIGLWSMTTLVAPVLGPILGGYFCDEYSWSWIFYINLPIAFAGGFFAWQLLQSYREPLQRNPIDRIGLVLLIVWVASLQLMLDEGKDLDWFASTKIVTLAIVAAIAFAAFLIWEFHEDHPIVDLRVFRHRGFTACVLTISLAFAAFFGASVLTPLWLQNLMGYTATKAGIATAGTGLAAFFVAPLVAQLSTRVDARKLVFGGVIWLGIDTMWRTVANTDMTMWNVALPLIFMGFGLPFFFIPTTGLALASVEDREMDSAAGLMNFLRTLSGAFATSVVTTTWGNQITRNHAELVGLADGDQSVRGMFEASGAPGDAVNQVIDYMITGQSVMLATNQLMLAIGLAFFIAASVIWLAPKPTRVVDPSAGGH